MIDFTQLEFVPGVRYVDVFNKFAELVHEMNIKWRLNLEAPCICSFDPSEDTEKFARKNPDPNCLDCKGHGYLPKKRDYGNLMMLAVSELAESMEGDRKNLNDDKLPHRKMNEVEVMDCFIRLFDTSQGKGFDFTALMEKMNYNQKREDHTIEHRLTENGKKY